MVGDCQPIVSRGYGAGACASGLWMRETGAGITAGEPEGVESNDSRKQLTSYQCTQIPPDGYYLIAACKALRVMSGQKAVENRCFL